MKWRNGCIALLLSAGLFSMYGCSDSVANAQEAGVTGPTVVDYHVVYGLTEEVSDEVRNLLASGWQPSGPLQAIPCVSNPNAYCGQQTLIRVSN